MRHPTPRIVWALCRLLEAEHSEHAGVTARLAALLAEIAASVPDGTLVTTRELRPLRRALRDASDARDAAILGKRPTDAMLLSAAGDLGEAIELLRDDDDAQARGYAGNALAPLSERWHELGRAASKEEALAALKSALRAQLAG